jgi:hypothetical protein
MQTYNQLVFAEMSPFLRFFSELAQLHACLDARDFRRYLGCVLSTGADVARQRTLVPADLAMLGAVSVTVRRKRIVVPLDDIRKVLADYDQTPTFGAVREMYAGDAYLRAFPSDLRSRVVVDLGSNRGMFLMLAAQVLESELAIGVEPRLFYDAAFETLRRANGLDTGKFVRITKRASAVGGADSVTIKEIMDEHAVSSIGFLKCDIEGGEFDVFLENNEFLSKVENIAMELHPVAGDVSRLLEVLVSYGFRVVATNQFGRPVDPRSAQYLYAWRDESAAAKSTLTRMM